MIPFFRPEMTGREMGYLKRALLWPNEGPLTAEFEKKLAKVIGVEHVICTTSGTAAMFLALKAVGIGPGIDVNIPDLTFAATASAVRMAGANPVLRDVDERGLLAERYGFDLPVHLSGRIANGVWPVEDACEAFPRKPTGYAACYSFSPMKLLTTGQGGAVATSDDRLAALVRAYKDHGRPIRDGDVFPSVGFNFKFTDLQAAVGLAQLSALDRRIERRREIHARYARHLPVIPFRDDELPLWTDILLDDRERVTRALDETGIGYRRYWKPLHTQPAFASERAFPMADDLSRKGLWLPSGLDITDEEIDRVASIILGVSQDATLVR